MRNSSENVRNFVIVDGGTSSEGESGELGNGTEIGVEETFLLTHLRLAVSDSEVYGTLENNLILSSILNGVVFEFL